MQCVQFIANEPYVATSYRQIPKQNQREPEARMRPDITRANAECMSKRRVTEYGVEGGKCAGSKDVPVLSSKMSCVPVMYACLRTDAADGPVSDPAAENRERV